MTAKTRRAAVPSEKPRFVLDVHASAGRYSLDLVVQEFKETGVFVNDPYPSYLALARRRVDIAAFDSMWTAQILQSDWKSLKRTKRFFDNLELIKHLIERNKCLEDEITFSIRRQRPLAPRAPYKALTDDEERAWQMASEHERATDAKEALAQSFAETPKSVTERLSKQLSDLGGEIKNYISTFEPERPRGGNLDPLSHHFISNMYDAVWCQFRGRVFAKSEYRPFARLLAAAWRDVGFPLEDHRGRLREPLEDWFTDRVRKLFFTRNLPAVDFEANSLAIEPGSR